MTASPATSSAGPRGTRCCAITPGTPSPAASSRWPKQLPPPDETPQARRPRHDGPVAVRRPDVAVPELAARLPATRPRRLLRRRRHGLAVPPGRERDHRRLLLRGPP